MKYYEIIKQALDRPGGRTILGALMGLNYYLLNHEWLSVRYHPQGYWLMRYADGAVVPLPIPDASLYQDKEKVACDAYFHRYVPRFGDTVVHVGAGAGWEANLLSRLVGETGHAYLIEAHPRTFQWMLRRIEASQLTNVTPIHIAVSDMACELHMTDDEDHMLNQVTMSGDIRVSAKTLEEIIISNGIQNVDLMTMNIEGAEQAAIQGLGSAANRVKRFSISCHDFLADRGGPPSTRTKAAVDGYDVFIRDITDHRDWTRDYLYAERKDIMEFDEQETLSH